METHVCWGTTFGSLLSLNLFLHSIILCVILIKLGYVCVCVCVQNGKIKFNMWKINIMDFGLRSSDTFLMFFFDFLDAKKKFIISLR
jgi:hypothetical protein